MTDELGVIAAAFHRSYCRPCATGSHTCTGTNSADERRAAEWLVNRHLLQVAGVVA